MFIDIDLPDALPSAPPVRVFLQPFDSASFDDANFNRHAIHCPESICRSVVKRRAEYFYGRYCAQRALELAGHVGVQVLSGAEREPLWPTGVRGSITHSDGMAAAAVLPSRHYRGLGIDIASPIGPDMWKAVVGIAVTPHEYQFLAGLPAAFGMERYLGLVFSAKESYFKGLFEETRQYFDFHALEICGIDCDRQLLRFLAKQQVCPELPVGAHFELPFRILENGDLLTVFSWC